MIEEIDFAFLFCRVMAEYSISFKAVKALPFKLFWLMSNNISRLRAERDIRGLMVANCSQAQDATVELRSSLMTELGTIMKVDPIKSAVRDVEGLNELKAMAND